MQVQFPGVSVSLSTQHVKTVILAFNSIPLKAKSFECYNVTYYTYDTYDSNLSLIEHVVLNYESTMAEHAFNGNGSTNCC